ncbi:MAG TPA: hypothetical protein VMI72_06230 [Roseiarcus sp.]|nr:hypothetical protein [Roseiarcus sp.]
MLNRTACIGLSALPTLLTPLPAPAQTGKVTAAATAASIPNRATVRAGTHRARAQHRGTLNRQGEGDG